MSLTYIEVYPFKIFYSLDSITKHNSKEHVDLIFNKYLKGVDLYKLSKIYPDNNPIFMDIICVYLIFNYIHKTNISSFLAYFNYAPQLRNVLFDEIQLIDKQKYLKRIGVFKLLDQIKNDELIFNLL